jgi:hypothetical protein
MRDELASTDTPALPGVRLYHPGVLAAYFLLGNLPIGMALYALNLARRGDRWIGYVLFFMSATALLALLLAGIAGTDLRPWRLLAVLVGLGVWQIETPAYRNAIRRGATPASWWPPLLAVLALALIVWLLQPAA